MTRGDEEYKNIKKKLDHMASEVNPGGKILDIGKNENHPEEARKGGKIASKNTVTGKIDKESVYTSAYKTFKEGKYDEARTGFRNFLKQFPNTEYSDRAQFWVGECYYFEKKYEEAILEYEKVIKNYPNGNKVSSALLKQGFSFLNLGDRPSAKLLLQQVVKDYPNTNQARIARVKLLEIK
jgi:tol-pal system protein YbgF